MQSKFSCFTALAMRIPSPDRYLDMVRVSSSAPQTLPDPYVFPKSMFSTFQGILTILEMGKKAAQHPHLSSVATCTKPSSGLSLKWSFSWGCLETEPLWSEKNAGDLSSPGASCTRSSFPWNKTALNFCHALKCYGDFPPSLKSKPSPHFKLEK